MFNIKLCYEMHVFYIIMPKTQGCDKVRRFGGQSFLIRLCHIVITASTNIDIHEFCIDTTIHSAYCKLLKKLQYNGRGIEHTQGKKLKATYYINPPRCMHNTVIFKAVKMIIFRSKSSIVPGPSI